MTGPTPPAAYKDLCLDAEESAAAATARFWATALGLRAADDRGTTVRLDGATPQDTVWINAVPEPRTAGNRMHIDVHAGSLGELKAHGATEVRRLPRWTVMADPDGGEFCAFVRAEVPARRLYEIVLDAHDPRMLANWWAALLGGRSEADDDGSCWVEDIPGAPFECLVVVPSDTVKTVKNRVHLDVWTAAVSDLVVHGARLLAHRRDWTVLADPEGNEFCAFVRPIGRSRSRA